MLIIIPMAVSILLLICAAVQISSDNRFFLMLVVGLILFNVAGHALLGPGSLNNQTCEYIKKE